MRVACQYLPDGGQQGGGLGLIAVEHFVLDRQAFGGLHHTEHELTGNHAFFGHTVMAHIVEQLCLTFHPDSGQVAYFTANVTGISR